MNFKRLIVILALALFFAGGNVSAKTLLEKTMFFVTPQGKIDSCKFWKLYIGSYPATLVRKFPGEDSLPVNTELNLTVLSSGYIEGYGYCKKGRVDCGATFVIDTGSGTIKLPVDSIDWVIDGGDRVKPKGMKLCHLAIDVEENKQPAVKRMTLTKYKLVTEYEERNLKPDGDVVLTIFGFSKPALLNAQKAAATPVAPVEPKK